MASKKKQPALGKGLEALIPSISFSQDKGIEVPAKEEERVEDRNFPLIEIDQIYTNPYQPREDFDLKALENLKNSILEHGVISPITVRRTINGYELLAGERRLRASKEAKLDKIPAYILDVKTDVQKLELALIENLLREDLNPIEVAHGYQSLIEEFDYTQEQVSEKVGLDRSTITNFLRLLRLPESIQEKVRKKELTMGHARALLGLSESQKMLYAGNRIVEKKLSVRATEKLVRGLETGRISIDGAQSKKKPVVDNETALVLEANADRLRHIFGTKVNINPKSKDSGKIEFEFYSNDDLERLLDLLYLIENKSE